MTLTDALNKAALLGLLATEEDGFCCLRRPGAGLEARGGTWEETFARLEAAQASAPKLAGETPSPGPPPAGQLF